jgi:hypothetical protein
VAPRGDHRRRPDDQELLRRRVDQPGERPSRRTTAARPTTCTSAAAARSTPPATSSPVKSTRSPSSRRRSRPTASRRIQGRQGRWRRSLRRRTEHRGDHPSGLQRQHRLRRRPPVGFEGHRSVERRERGAHRRGPDLHHAGLRRGAVLPRPRRVVGSSFHGRPGASPVSLFSGPRRSDEPGNGDWRVPLRRSRIAGSYLAEKCRFTPGVTEGDPWGWFMPKRLRRSAASHPPFLG